MAKMGVCIGCSKVLNYPEDDAIVGKQGILCIACGEESDMIAGWIRDNYKCRCGNDAEYVADNNEAGKKFWYCGKCEEHRSDKYGCALIISEGVMCQDGACGCDGTGVYS